MRVARCLDVGLRCDVGAARDGDGGTPCPPQTSLGYEADGRPGSPPALRGLDPLRLGADRAAGGSRKGGSCTNRPLACRPTCGTVTSRHTLNRRRFNVSAASRYVQSPAVAPNPTRTT